MSAADLTVRLQALDGNWETCGADRAIGVAPDSLQLVWNKWGPDKASFTLARNPAQTWPDLAAYAPVEIEIGGIVVWKGRTLETPFKEGAERIINVQAEGMQYHFDDDVYERCYVHSKLTDYKDSRSFPTCQLATYLQSGNVQVAQGRITLGYSKGDQVVKGQAVGVTLDLGPLSTGAVVVAIDAELVGSGTGYAFYAIGHSAFTAAAEVWANRHDTVSAAALATTTYNGALITASRYISLLISREGANEERAEDLSLILKAVRVFTAVAYEASGISVLKASQIIPDALERATQLISSDHSQIQATTFSIPDFALSKLSTPREVIEAANAYHNWVTELDLQDRMVFAPRPTSPELEIGAWSGAQVEDASANSGAEIYDRAIVEATGPDGSPLAVEKTRAAAEPETLVERRGFHRTKVLQVSSAITATEGEQIGKVFLEGHTQTPFKGSVKITPGGVRRVLGGVNIHPSQMGMHVNELLRLSHLVDPDTGGIGRDGTIAGVTYTHHDQTAAVELDEQRGSFEALLSRLAVVQTPGS